MSRRRTVTVSITSEQDALLRAFLVVGRYGSISRVLRFALRLFERNAASSRATLMGPATKGEAERG